MSGSQVLSRHLSTLEEVAACKAILFTFYAGGSNISKSNVSIDSLPELEPSSSSFTYETSGGTATTNVSQPRPHSWDSQPGQSSDANIISSFDSTVTGSSAVPDDPFSNLPPLEVQGTTAAGFSKNIKPVGSLKLWSSDFPRDSNPVGKVSAPGEDLLSFDGGCLEPAVFRDGQVGTRGEADHALAGAAGGDVARLPRSEGTGCDPERELALGSEHTTNSMANSTFGGGQESAASGGAQDWDAEWVEYEHANVPVSGSGVGVSQEQPVPSAVGPVMGTFNESGALHPPVRESSSVSVEVGKSNEQMAGDLMWSSTTVSRGVLHRGDNVEDLPSHSPRLDTDSPQEHAEAEMAWGDFESAAVSAAAPSAAMAHASQAESSEPVDGLGLFSNLTVSGQEQNTDWSSQSAVVGHKVVRSDTDFMWEANIAAKDTLGAGPSASMWDPAGSMASARQAEQLHEEANETGDTADSSKGGDPMESGMEGDLFSFVAGTLGRKTIILTAGESGSGEVTAGSHQQVKDGSGALTLDPCDTIEQWPSVQSPSPFLDKESIGAFDGFTGAENCKTQFNNDGDASPSVETAHSTDAVRGFRHVGTPGSSTTRTHGPSPLAVCSSSGDGWGAFQGIDSDMCRQEESSVQQGLPPPAGFSASTPVSAGMLLNGRDDAGQLQREGLEYSGIGTPSTSPPREVHHGHEGRRGTQGLAWGSLDEWGSFQGEPAMPVVVPALSPAQVQAPSMFPTSLNSPLVHFPGTGISPMSHQPAQEALPGFQTVASMAAVDSNPASSRDATHFAGQADAHNGLPNAVQSSAAEDDGWGEFQSEAAADPFSSLNPIR